MIASTTYPPDRAHIHRPSGRDALRIAALDLARQGHRPRDIAGALGLTAVGVVDLLRSGGAA